MAQKYKLQFFFPNENACFYKISNDTALYCYNNMLIVVLVFQKSEAMFILWLKIRPYLLFRFIVDKV